MLLPHLAALAFEPTAAPGELGAFSVGAEVPSLELVGTTQNTHTSIPADSGLKATLSAKRCLLPGWHAATESNGTKLSELAVLGFITPDCAPLFCRRYKQHLWWADHLAPCEPINLSQYICSGIESRSDRLQRSPRFNRYGQPIKPSSLLAMLSWNLTTLSMSTTTRRAVAYTITVPM